jgi:pimeloyl-ACP methyl ester carboxylesterase
MFNTSLKWVLSCFGYCTLLMITYQGNSQPLQPRFDKAEYLRLNLVSEANYLGNNNSITANGVTYTLKHRSFETQLLNMWAMYMGTDSTVVIDIRGTVNKPISWLENFYAPMVPATGSITLTKDKVFPYKLATHPEASVHTGWLLGLADIGPAIADSLKLAHSRGIKKCLLMGHSQGGALTFLLAAYLHYLPDFPKGLRIKAYASAPPKPGNQRFAYDFDARHLSSTGGSWAYRVSNSADWVPSTPFSVQQLSNSPATNPFNNIGPGLKNLNLIARSYVKTAFRRMDKRTKKAARTFRNYLGDDVYKLIAKARPGMPKPVYTSDNDFATAGAPVILLPDSAYFSKYPEKSEEVFKHHFYAPYRILVEKL